MPEELPQHDAAFRRRRGINWLTLGFGYAALYMGRYNLSIANKSLSDEFGWSKGDIGWIASAGYLTYGLSTVINGPLTDRFGGRRVLLFGTAGASLCNLLFGLGAFFGVEARSWLLAYFVTIFALNNYFQSFGACAIVKVNTPWFHVRERGVFGGIFGAMIQGGRALTYLVTGPLIAWLTWRWGFFFPAGLLALMFAFVWRFVRDTPEAAGLPAIDTGDNSEAFEGRVPLSYLIRRVFTNPVMLTLTLASFCIGFSRQGLDFWMPRYLFEVHHVDGASSLYVTVTVGAVLCGILGGLLAGTLSDRFFHARRPPVIFIFFLGQVVSFAFLAQQAWGTLAAAAAIFGASLCINACHSLLAGVSTMDFGGKHASGSAAGLVDGVQYLASSLAGHGLGTLLDRHGWSIWGYSLIPTAAIGACLMALLWNARPGRQTASAEVEAAA